MPLQRNYIITVNQSQSSFSKVVSSVSSQDNFREINDSSSVTRGNINSPILAEDTKLSSPAMFQMGNLALSIFHKWFAKIKFNVGRPFKSKLHA
jgi:hypothetical protein